MYLPPAFALSDPHRQLALMRAHPFAVVVADPAGGHEAAHLPLLAERIGERFVLHGHVARGAPLWRATRALAVFSGPHAFVSAAWYDEPDTVPTWNYLAVHASGPLTVVDQPEAVRRLFERLGEEHDPEAARWWNGLSAEAYARLAGAIVWFRIDVERVEGKAKLSQNHAPARRAKAIAALRARGGDDRSAIAEAMERASGNG